MGEDTKEVDKSSEPMDNQSDLLSSDEGGKKLASDVNISQSGSTCEENVEHDGKYDEIEKSLGISEYYSSVTLSGFSAVVKARYSDFLVHEIDLNGDMARLTSLEVPKVESSVKVGADEVEAAGGLTKPPDGMEEKKLNSTSQPKEERGEKNSLDFDGLESQFANLINDADVANKVMVLLKSHNQNEAHTSMNDDTNKTSEVDGADKSEVERSNESLEKFVTLPSLEKDQRRSVHEWVRNCLTCARADTLDGKIRIWHSKFEKEMPNYKAFGTHKKRKMSDRALKKKARTNWPSDRPDFLQFVMYKENCDTTTAAKELSRRGSTARIGYAGMKDKRGITSQFCTLYRTLPEQMAKSNDQQRGGGGNTKQKGFSVVKIGNFKFVPKELKLGSLKGNRFDIILRNVKLLDESNNTEAKRKDVLEKAAQAMKNKGFINYFGTQRFGKFNNTHLVGIAVLKGDFKKAVDVLLEPNSEDRPDITQARNDWKNRFTYGETKENESSTAKRVLKRLNRFMTAEIAILQSLAKNPFDYKKAFSRIPKNLRMMFIHAVQSLIWNQATSYRIAKMDRDNVLVGDLVRKDKEEGASQSNVHIVSEGDIEENKYSMEDILVPVVGSKTIFPTNELGSVLKDLLGKLGLTVEMFKTIEDREIRANGDYRNAIIHPKDFDFIIKEYYHPLQPLLQTDLMKLNGEEVTIEPKEKEDSPTLVAMVVGFTLPSSSYATIALRELMKTPTSNEYQMKLKLQ